MVYGLAPVDPSMLGVVFWEATYPPIVAKEVGPEVGAPPKKEEEPKDGVDTICWTLDICMAELLNLEDPTDILGAMFGWAPTAWA